MLRYLFVVLLLSSCTPAIQSNPAIDAAIESEAKAYSAMLQDKVAKGEMSDAEARYLWERKVNELTERAVSMHRAMSPTPPQRTRCVPDGYGGVRCTTR